MGEYDRRQMNQLNKAISHSESKNSQLKGFVDDRPHAASQIKLINSIQKKLNNTGLPNNLKSGIENLSGYSMDDVKVHYNSDKPAQLSALAYAQGTDIYVAPGQEQHLPHEAWHVVQQKQGRVQPTMQMQGVSVNDNEGLEREADVMGGVVLSGVDDKTNETLETALSLKSVLQRQIIINSEKVDKHGILAEMVAKTKGSVHRWLTDRETSAMFRRNQDLCKEATATESNIKASKYLDQCFDSHIPFLLDEYDNINRTFKDKAQLESQLIQDVKLRILRLDYFVGIDHHTGQFSQRDTSGGDKPLRIYRTTTRGDWNAYLESSDIAGLIHGHGGSLGQALYYFYKSKTDNSGQYSDNVIFEIEITKNASSAIDYGKIAKGGEGDGPSGEKLTGKNEGNDIFRENDVFSINLTKCKNCILSMNPTIRRVDEIKGEHSKKLIELGLKYGEYPPQNLTIEERRDLEFRE